MRITALWLLAAATVLAGCATSPLSEEQIQAKAEEQQRRAEKIAERRFQVGEQIDKIVFPKLLNGWGYIDDNTFWVESRPRHYYLITTKSRCPELNFTQSIGFKSQTGAYLMRFDQIIIDHDWRRVCWINEIYKMTRTPKSKDENEN